MRNAIFAFLLAISLASAFDTSRCYGTNGSTNYTVISDGTYTSSNNGVQQMGSPGFSSISVVGFAYGDMASPGGTLTSQIGPFTATPPYVLQFDIFNKMGTVFDINYSAADLNGVILINYTTISSTSGSCAQTDIQYINQTLNIIYHCTGVSQNGSVTIEVTNDLGLSTRATRGLIASHEGWHCFFGVNPLTFGTATLAVNYAVSDPFAHVTAYLNGHALGNLSNSGSDVFIGIPLAWLQPTSLADYVSLSPAANTTSVNITSSVLSYYGNLTYYPNYTANFAAGTITTQNNGTFYATYGHASDFDKLIISISGLFPLLLAVAILLLVWRVGAYWERTGN